MNSSTNFTSSISLSVDKICTILFTLLAWGLHAIPAHMM